MININRAFNIVLCVFLSSSCASVNCHNGWMDVQYLEGDSTVGMPDTAYIRENGWNIYQYWSLDELNKNPYGGDGYGRMSKVYFVLFSDPSTPEGKAVRNAFINFCIREYKINPAHGIYIELGPGGVRYEPFWTSIENYETHLEMARKAFKYLTQSGFNMSRERRWFNKYCENGQLLIPAGSEYEVD